MKTRVLESGVYQYDNLLLVTGGVIDAAEKGKTTVVDVYNCSSKNWTTPQALELPERICMVLVVHVYIFLNVKMGTSNLTGMHREYNGVMLKKLSSNPPRRRRVCGCQ